MAILAAVLLAASSTPPPVNPAAAERQAVATVRILPGAQVRFAEIEKTAPASFTEARIRGTDGSPQRARLIEFH